MTKLCDANNAGSKRGNLCTLILTEGDSAKALAVAGLSVLGRDKFGVFPLKGKLLNCLNATTDKILENKEINDLIKILGLSKDGKSMRYGSLIWMRDADTHGIHIEVL